MHEYVTVPIKFSPDSLADFESRFISALNNEDYKVIVLTGGPTYFSMGMDLTYISTHYDADFVSQFCHILKMVRNSHKPVLAKVEGNVIAGGLPYCRSSILFCLAIARPLVCQKSPLELHPQ